MSTRQFKLIEEFLISDEERSQIKDLLCQSFPDIAFTEAGTYVKQIAPRRLVVSENDMIVGQLGIEHRVIKLADGPACIFGVIDLCVAASCRSQGIATDMLRWVEKLAIENGIEFLVLFSQDSRLYKRNGFRHPHNKLKWLKIHEHQILGIGNEVLPELMVKELSSRIWPLGDVDLLGYVF